MEDSKTDKIQQFEDLKVWQQAQKVAVLCYQQARKFPKDENFGLISQIRRSSSSVSANIAEGFGRKTAKDKLQFYTIAYGSLLETKNFLLLAVKLEYLHDIEVESLLEEIVVCQKLLNAFMKPLRTNA